MALDPLLVKVRDAAKDGSVRIRVTYPTTADSGDEVDVGSTRFLDLYAPVLGPTAALLAFQLVSCGPGRYQLEDLGKAVGVSWDGTETVNRKSGMSPLIRAFGRLVRCRLCVLDEHDPTALLLVGRARFDSAKHARKLPSWVI